MIRPTSYLFLLLSFSFFAATLQAMKGEDEKPQRLPSPPCAQPSDPRVETRKPRSTALNELYADQVDDILPASRNQMQLDALMPALARLGEGMDQFSKFIFDSKKEQEEAKSVDLAPFNTCIAATRKALYAAIADIHSPQLAAAFEAQGDELFDKFLCLNSPLIVSRYVSLPSFNRLLAATELEKNRLAPDIKDLHKNYAGLLVSISGLHSSLVTVKNAHYKQTKD